MYGAREFELWNTGINWIINNSITLVPKISVIINQYIYTETLKEVNISKSSIIHRSRNIIDTPQPLITEWKTITTFR